MQAQIHTNGADSTLEDPIEDKKPKTSPRAGPRHPGVFLKQLFLDPDKITISQLRAATKIPQSVLTDIINGDHSINGEISVRLDRCLGMTDGFFMKLQYDYDVFIAICRVNEGEPVRSLVHRKAKLN